MQDLPVVFPIQSQIMVPDRNVAFCEADVGRDACFGEEILDYQKIQLEKSLRTGVQDREELIFVIVEIRRGLIRRGDRPFRFQHPGSRVIHFDLGDRQLMGALMDDGEIEISGAVSGEDPATVAPGLLLVVLAGLNINDGRNGVFRRKHHSFSYQREITDRREPGDAKEHGTPTLSLSCRWDRSRG